MQLDFHGFKYIFKLLKKYLSNFKDIIMTDNNSMISLSRALVILDTVAESPAEGVSFNVLKSRCNDLAGATLSRLLKNLTARDMLGKNTENGRYIAGRRFEALAGKLLNRSSRSDVIQAAVNKQSEATGQSAAYWEMSSDGVRIIVKHEVPDGHYFGAIGWSNKDTAINEYGQMCLAFSPKNRIEEVIKSTRLPYSKETLLRRLEKIKGKKLLISRKASGLCRVIAPIFENGTFSGACGISFWSVDFEAAKKYAGPVKDTAVELSNSLTKR